MSKKTFTRLLFDDCTVAIKGQGIFASFIIIFGIYIPAIIGFGFVVDLFFTLPSKIFEDEK